jgi:hypothetical protein
VLFRRSTPLALALVAGLVLLGCTDDDKSATPPGVSGNAATKVVLLRLGPADLVSPAAATRPLDDPTIAAAMGVAQRVFDATLLDPLTSGRAGSIDEVFTPDAAREAATTHRDAMYDEGLPRATSVKASKYAVQLTGFADDRDQLMTIIAKVAWDVRGESGRHDVRVVREGELILTPAFGTWFVSAYEMTNQESVSGKTTTTAAARS